MSKKKSHKPNHYSTDHLSMTASEGEDHARDLARIVDVEQSQMFVDIDESSASVDAPSASFASAVDVEQDVSLDRDVVETSTGSIEVAADLVSEDAVDAGHLEAPVAESREQVMLPISLGQRLSAAREVRGLSREEVARRLRITPSVIADIESDQWQRLGAAVYVRGHLTSYARMLEIPPVVVTHALKSLEEPAPPLVLAVSAGPSATIWRRYSSAATYVILTVLLAIPVFTLLDKRGFNSTVPTTAPIRSLSDSEFDAANAVTQQRALVPAQPDVSEFVGPPTPTTTSQGTTLAADSDHGQGAPPLMASMTPIGSRAAASAGAHRIELAFTNDSWLEIFDANDARLDYGMARAGERRVHTVDGPITMSIGNVNGAVLRVDGETVDLASFARLNVARLKLFESQPTTDARPR